MKTFGQFWLITLLGILSSFSVITQSSGRKVTSLSSDKSPFKSNFKCTRPKVQLPQKLIVGYANWGQCDEKIVQAAKNGVNTIIWFSIDLLHNSTTGKPYINRGPDPDCVSKIYRQLKDLELETVHLISIGGWNSPHPETQNSAQEVFAEFSRWNDQVVSRPEVGFYGYDGIDWDIEGNDDFSSQFNHLTVQSLDLMGEFSQLAKTKGLIVSMAPAESYLDPTTSLFDRDLNHTYEEWDPIIPNFNYRGRNAYGYLISKYGSVEMEDSHERIDTFDFVTIQLYEGYSHALYNTSKLGQPASEYIRNIVEKFDQGWFVDFSSDSAINWISEVVRVDPQRLVIGLANGWADNDKFLLLPSGEVCLGYKYLTEVGMDVKGFAFWNIFDEGHTIPDGEELWLAKDLNGILKIRNGNTTADFC